MWDILWAHILQTDKMRTSKTNSSLPYSCCSRNIRVKVAIIFLVPDEPDGFSPPISTHIFYHAMSWEISHIPNSLLLVKTDISLNRCTAYTINILFTPPTWIKMNMCVGILSIHRRALFLYFIAKLRALA